MNENTYIHLYRGLSHLLTWPSHPPWDGYHVHAPTLYFLAASQLWISSHCLGSFPWMSPTVHSVPATWKWNLNMWPRYESGLQCGTVSEKGSFWNKTAISEEVLGAIQSMGPNVLCDHQSCHQAGGSLAFRFDCGSFIWSSCVALPLLYELLSTFLNKFLNTALNVKSRERHSTWTQASRLLLIICVTLKKVTKSPNAMCFSFIIDHTHIALKSLLV